MTFRIRCLILLLAAILPAVSCERREQDKDDAALALAVREVFEQSPDLKGATAHVQVRVVVGRGRQRLDGQKVITPV